MKVKSRIKLHFLTLLWWKWRLSVNAKKNLKKDKDPKKKDLQKRNDYLLKVTNKMLKILKIKVKIEGYENLPKKGQATLMPNHVSSIDGLIVHKALSKNTFDKNENHKIPTFLAKKEIEALKVFSSMAYILDTFFIDRSNPRATSSVFDNMIAYVKENKTYPVIFPSGTRVIDGTVGKFIPGSFKFAKKGHFPIIPVTINKSIEAMDFNRTNEVEVEIIFHKQIKPLSFINIDTISLANRVQNIISSKYIPSKVSPYAKAQHDKDHHPVLQKQLLDKIKTKEAKRDAKKAKEDAKELKIVNKLKAEESKKLSKDKEIAQKYADKEKLKSQKKVNKNGK